MDFNNAKSQADDVQFGGDHYKRAGKIQHWNAVVMLGFGWEYFLAAASKYATRYRDKNGLQDVEKAGHYIEKLIELVEAGTVPERFQTTQGLRLNLDSRSGPYTRNVNVEAFTNDYVDAYAIPRNSHAHNALFAMFAATTAQDLYFVRDRLRDLYNDVAGVVPETPAIPTPAELATQRAHDAANTLGAEAGPDYVNQ